MAWTQNDVDALERAIADAGNAEQVSFGDGREVRNMPVKDALLLLETMRKSVQQSAPASSDPGQRPLRAYRAIAHFRF